MNYKDLEQYLFNISDKKFADFSKSLSNSDYISIGVKNPVLRSIVKDRINDKELKLEDFDLGKYLEVDLIYFSLALSRRKDIDAQLKFLEDNIYKAKSWAVTDCITTYIKKLTFEKYWSFFKNNHNSKYTYTRRMSYVLGLKVYKEKEILEILSHIRENEEYMVMMAEAWLLATMAILYPEEVYNFLKATNDITLKRKAISKVVESFRIDDKAKERYKSLR